MSRLPFSTKVVKEGDWTRVVFIGPINEDARAPLNALEPTLGKRIVLDMEHVTQLNSCGIRDWSLFIRAMKKDREVVFDRCTDEVIRTMNMVTNFHGRLPVMSLFRAYGCENCGNEQMEFFRAGADYKGGELPATPTKKCSKCGQDTLAFEQDNEFFQFLLTA